ncbi:hypothetical protein [Methylobacterium platani]|uniref:Uncharacterized protein n=2 Tax=Methylobacterium platani TaxID=427683 RepID=A0A179SCC9_9HYPH|nr:hypothetical protein [Methylobacterium platani]KMO12171.1 hypothetical protein SQ03_25170 [Methylobacterium platani JCM 14648]OAS25519.1 hypothetical protein A5481_09155 [Methylobacterium platani]
MRTVLAPDRPPDRRAAFGAPCPACRLPVRAGRLVCTSCGCLIPVEAAAGRFRRSVRILAAVAAGRLLALRGEALVWIMALVPLLVGPPLAAAALAVMRHRRDARAGPFPTWLLVVAGANIVLSLAMWSVLSVEILQQIQAGWQGLRDLLIPSQRVPVFRYA